MKRLAMGAVVTGLTSVLLPSTGQAHAGHAAMLAGAFVTTRAVAHLPGVRGALPAAASTAMKTYTDGTHSISLRYPRTWLLDQKEQLSGYPATLTKTQDYLMAPDYSATIAVLVQNGRVPAAAVKTVGRTLYFQGTAGKVVGLVTMGQKTIGRTTFITWSGMIMVPDIYSVKQTLYMAEGASHTVYVRTWLTTVNRAKGSRLLRTIVNTIIVH